MNILNLVKNNINSIYVKYIKNENIIEEPIFYIAGAQTLPPPLPEEEELYYIKKLSEKDNLEARQMLIERNLRLVVYIAKKFENTGTGIEDLISIGTIGLAKGVNTFKSDKNIKLATYASRCIENEILMYLRRTNKTKGEVSLDEPLNKDADGNELLLSDILGTDEDITSRSIEDEVDRRLLRASINKLNSREKNIMEMRFGLKNDEDEKTQKEVADELRDITKLHIKARKKDYKKNEKGNNEQNRLKYLCAPKILSISGIYHGYLRFLAHLLFFFHYSRMMKEKEEKDFMKIKKYVLGILFVSLLFIFSISFNNKSYASLYLNNLNFDVQINSDASMNVTEIWDIHINETNTLFKTFKTDKTKYSGIKDVIVTDITNSNEIAFNKIDKLMYHVTKNCYYGLINDDGNFEIAWGVGLDNSSATRKYMIQYKVENAIAKYNDYAELYWQFVGSDFEIDSSKITGKIRLPYKAPSKEDIKVWGHTEGLNGTIYATSNDTIEFEINKFKSGRFVEIRSLFPSDMILYSTRTFYENRLENVVAEETVWANEANARRLRRQKLKKIATGVAGVIYVLVSGTFLKKAYNGIKKAKEINPYKKTENVEYFREIPRNNATPSQAISIYKKSALDFSSTEVGRIFSAVLLDLCLKKCIEFETSPENKKEVKIKIIKKIEDNLEWSEKYILDFIVNIPKAQDEITVKELKKYMKNHATKVAKIKEKIDKSTKKEITKNKLYDEKRAEERSNYAGTSYGYTIFMLIILIFGTFFVATLVSGKVILYGIIALFTTAIINIFVTKHVSKKLQPFTDEGLNESEKWKGLKKFMENFSMLDKREIPELALWEHYLVYATAFGVADKVLKQLKIVYKDVYENMDNYGYMYLMMNTDFSSSFSNAISSSVSSSYTSTLSSGSGSGGGFSGGGGGGRRRPEVVAEDSHN